jgi:hypothetical protein
MGELEPWMDENFIKGVFMSTTAEQVNVKVIRDKNSGYGTPFLRCKPFTNLPFQQRWLMFR